MITRSDGDTKIKYNFETLEFGTMTQDGVIITYYRLTEEYRSTDDFHEYIGGDIFSR